MSIGLEAVPAAGYRFESWSGDLSGTTSPAIVMIDCDKAITASFSEVASLRVKWPLVGVAIGGLALVGGLAFYLAGRRRAS